MGAQFDTTTAIWGWLALASLIVVVAIPYFRRKGPSVGAESSVPRAHLSRLIAHFWIAPAVLAISFVHAWIPMASGHMPRTSMNGLWLATYALGLMFVQIVLGIALRYFGLRTARVLKRVHLALMLGIVALVLLHLALNGRFSPRF